MSSSLRYALRREHFGGLILDYETASCELLAAEEYEMLERLLLRKDRSAESQLDKQATEGLSLLWKIGIVGTDRDGQLNVSNVRLIPPLDKLPDDCLSAPIMVYDTYTRTCDLSCKHCYSSSSPAFSEVRRTLEQTEAVMKRFYETGTMEWRFTGGEPTVVPDLLDAINIARSIGMTVSLNTNGCWNHHVAARILDSGISGVVISLEGRKETNDQRRGSGVFRQVTNTLRQIAEHNQIDPARKIAVVVNTTVGKDNIGDIGFVVRLAANHEFDVNFVPFKPSGRASRTGQNMMLSTEDYLRFARRVQQLRRDPQIQESKIRISLKHKDLFCPNYRDKSDLPVPFNYSECHALTAAIGLFSDGRVFACPFLMDDPRFVGPNVLDVTVHEAWFDSSMQSFRKAVKVGCTDCGFYMQQCRGKCRAAVLLSGGTIEEGMLIGQDPYCFRDLMPRQTS